MAFVNVAAGIVTLRYLAAPTTADSGSMIQSVIALGKYSNNNALLHYILLFPILSQISSPGLNSFNMILLTQVAYTYVNKAD